MALAIRNISGWIHSQIKKHPNISEYIIAISVALFSALDNKYDHHHHLHFRV